MKKFLILSLVMVFMVGCSSITPLNKEKKAPKETQVVEKKEVPETFSVFEGVVKPGEVTLLTATGPFVKDGILTCDTEEVYYFLKGNQLFAFVSETYFSKLKPFECYYKDPKRSPVKIADFKVVNKDFPSERLKVDKKRVFLSKENQARANRESAIRAKAYNSSPKRPYFFGPFELPIHS